MTEPRMGGEVYNLDYYVNKAKDLEAMGADSICIKDMAGLHRPLRRLRPGQGPQGSRQGRPSISTATLPPACRP